MNIVSLFDSLMELISNWWLMNYANAISIVISGMLSIVISQWYFSKGNRNNLQMNVILPIIEVLENSEPKNVFRNIEKYSGDYHLKYMRKNERKLLTKLVISFGDLKSYDEDTVMAHKISSYFEYKLRQNNIGLCTVPVKDECGEYIDSYSEYEHKLRDEICYEQNLRNVITHNCIEWDEESFQKDLIAFFDWCCKEVYGDVKINLFDDHSLADVLGLSKITATWNEKFSIADSVKREFLQLKICKAIYNNVHK